jgi:hypothetical protein
MATGSVNWSAESTDAGWYDPNRNLAIGYCTRRLGGFAAVDRIEAALDS